MPDTFQEPTRGARLYSLWQERVTNTLRWRQNNWNGDNAWRRAYRMFRGDHWGVMNSGRDEIDSFSPRDLITVNETGAIIRQFLPFVLKRDPHILVKPRRLEYIVTAALKQEILNYEWRERRMKRQIKRGVRDLLIAGHTVMKTGFTLETTHDLSTKRGQKINFADYIKQESSFVKRISPFNFVFDPEASESDLNTARWCAEIFFKRPQDVLDNARYDQSVLRSIQESELSPGTIPSFMAVNSDYQSTKLDGLTPDGEDDLWVLYEVWDKLQGKYFVFLDGIDKPLVKGPWPYDYLDGFPYVKTDFIEVPDEHYGIGIPRWIEDQQFELNRVRTRWFHHGRRFNRKYKVLEGSISPSEKKKLREGEDGTIIEMKQSLDDIAPLDDVAMQSDQPAIEGMAKDDIRRMTGADELSQGGRLPSRTSATEIQTRTGILNLKTDEMAETVDSMIQEVMTQVDQHISANQTTDRIMQLTGPKGKFWVKATPEDIRGEVDIEIETASAPKADPLTERETALRVFTVTMQSLPVLMQAQQVPDIKELFRWLFEKFDDKKDIVRFFPAMGDLPKPPPEPAPTSGTPTRGGTTPGTTSAREVGPDAVGSTTSGNVIGAAQFGRILGGGLANVGV